MTRNPGDTEWTDERLDAAYRELASQAVAPELAGPVMAEIDAPAAREDRRRKPAWRRTATPRRKKPFEAWATPVRGADNFSFQNASTEAYPKSDS